MITEQRVVLIAKLDFNPLKRFDYFLKIDLL